MSLGTEKIEALAESLKKLAIVAKKVSADKKISIEDLPAAMALLPELPAIIKSFSDLGEVLDEGKDLDVAEVVALIQAIHSKVKEIEKA